MKNLSEIEVNIKEMNTPGSGNWDSNLENLKKWELTDDEINEIIEGKIVKCISPNGKRIIWITKK